MRKTKRLYYDVDNNYLMSSNTSTTSITITPSLFTNNKYIVALELVSNAVGYDVSDIVEWDAAFGNIGESLVTVTNAVFNDISDWSEVDTAIGKISLELDLDNAVDTDIGTTAISKYYYLQVLGTDSTNTRTIAQFKLNTYNTVMEPDDILSSSSSSGI